MPKLVLFLKIHITCMHSLSPWKGIQDSFGSCSPHGRESKTVLDPGFHTVDSGFPLLDSSLCDCLAPIQTSYFSGPYNLHYLLIQGIGALLYHHPFCFPSESQTLFGIGAGRPSLCHWNLGSGFQLLLGFPDFLSSILDSKAQDSGFHKQNVLGFRIPHAKISRIPQSGFSYMGRILKK